MILTAKWLLLLCLVAVGACGCGARPPAADSSNNEKILVVVNSRAPRSVSGPPGRAYRARSYRLDAAADFALDRIARRYGLRRVSGWDIRALDAWCEVFELPDGAAVEAVVREIASESRVVLVQPLQHFSTLGETAGPYDDPYLELQRSIDAMQVLEAHRWSRGRAVRVAVIDTVVDHRHPDLSGGIRESKRFLPNGVPSSAAAHGTGVAGVIASRANNGAGIVGVSPEAEVLAMAACWVDSKQVDRARCDSLSLARALDHAIRRRADVINLSLSGPDDPLLERLIRRALDAGIIVVAAGGTEPKLPFPANLPSVLAVRSGPIGDGVLTAPGDEILTTLPAARWGFMSGSSLAAAHVSGVVALMLGDGRRIEPERAFALLSGEQGAVSACRALLALDVAERCSPPEVRTAARH